MDGKKTCLLLFAITSTVSGGFLIGWTIGLIGADLVSRVESAVFLTLFLLFLATAIAFVIEYKRVDWNLI